MATVKMEGKELKLLGWKGDKVGLRQTLSRGIVNTQSGNSSPLCRSAQQTWRVKNANFKL